MTLLSFEENMKLREEGSIATTEPFKVTDRAGRIGSARSKNEKLTLAELVIQFCKINKNSSGSQIIFYVLCEEMKILRAASGRG
jgi:hypothetical protein